MSTDTDGAGARGEAGGGLGGSADAATIAEDVKTLHSLGYAQELLRRMSGFSNFAISFSIICILAGGITSFQLGFCSVGGAAIGIGWPLCCLITVAMALTMSQVASAFPTAGGLYHWSSILGGRGFGWVTAWFNLAGLVTVLAAINVGAYLFTFGWLGPLLGVTIADLSPTQVFVAQAAGVSVITFSQALFNHLGIRVTTLLTDFSGYLILAVAVLLTATLLITAPHLDFARLVTFKNYSGPAGGGTWPETRNMNLLFLLGFLLPAYTITGYDASAHTSEETVGAAVNVPRGILRAVIVSGLAGWVMISAITLAAPDMDAAAAKGADVVFFIINNAVPRPLAIALYAGITLAQYLCGLATVTSASRMTFAFARDGGLPFSQQLRRVSPAWRTPSPAIWTTAIFTVAFTVYTPVYASITAVCVIFLYISYVLPTALGLVAYGRRWEKMGPFQLGRWYRPLAVVSVLGCALVIVVSFQLDKALPVTLGAAVVTLLVWFGVERRRFQGPPSGLMGQGRGATEDAAIAAAERAVGQRS
jgi:amino acid transporter